MKVISYTIHLREPVLAKGLEGDPNSGVSYRFLPGSVLRGALIGQHLRGKRESYDLMQDEVARRLFFSPDATRFLNGYLLCRHYEETYRALPTPLSWHICKLGKRPSRIGCDNSGNSGSQLEHFDHAIQKLDVQDVCLEGEGDSWQQVKEPFCMPLSDQFAFAAVDRRISIHTARHRDYGRARAASEDADIFNGAVYRYEALEAGQTFAAHVLCQDEDVETLANLIKGEILLGGARMAGYGHVTLQLNPQPEENTLYQAEDIADWREFVPTGAGFDGIVITLLSDVLLRDKYGQPQSTVTELSRQLGLANELESVFAAYRPIGGFNRKWGLPTIQQTALKMGTVLVFSTPSDEQLIALRKLEQSGIGEQREDGFGRFAINWHTEASFTPTKLEAKMKKPPSLVGTTSEATAQTIVNKLHRIQLDGQLREQAKKLAEAGKLDMVSKTQLNGLRLQLQKAAHEIANKGEAEVAKQQEVLEAYRESLEKRAHTRRQFEKARLDKRPFLNWLEDSIKATKMPIANPKSYAIGEVMPETDTLAIRAEYNWRLADLILARVVKQRHLVKVDKEGKK
ncbi:MAG: hypothetical protein H6658_09835 [Ardenticatenaceae bacterium]|nr:hypothetical protein [Ardenticatenaceae bacterium]